MVGATPIKCKGAEVGNIQGARKMPLKDQFSPVVIRSVLKRVFSDVVIN